jgi:hypothetical protein
MGDTNVTPLAYKDFDPSLPFQTREGARQALRVGHNRIQQLVSDGSLQVVRFGRSARITTASILSLAGTADNQT